MFFWRNKQNYPLIITKYPPYLFHSFHSFLRLISIFIANIGRHIIYTPVPASKACWAGSTVSNASDCHSRGRRFLPQPGHVAFAEIGYEMISTVILSLPLIQVGQLSSMCTKCWLTTRACDHPLISQRGTI